MSVKGLSFLLPPIIVDLWSICHCKAIYSPGGKCKYCLTPVILSVQPLIKFSPALLVFRVLLLLGWDQNLLLLLSQYCEAHRLFQQSGAAELPHLRMADPERKVDPQRWIGKQLLPVSRHE